MTKKYSAKDKKFGLCLKNSSWVVLFQDTNCKSFCGEYVGKTCHRSCWRLAKEHTDMPVSDVGIQTFHNKNIEEQICDLSLVYNEDQIASILCPLNVSDAEEIETLAEKGFTAREIEILQLRKKGYKNIEIEVKLGVSQSTIKTHIGNILRKIKEDDLL